MYVNGITLHDVIVTAGGTLTAQATRLIIGTLAIRAQTAGYAKGGILLNELQRYLNSVIIPQ